MARIADESAVAVLHEIQVGSLPDVIALARRHDAVRTVYLVAAVR